MLAAADLAAVGEPELPVLDARGGGGPARRRWPPRRCRPRWRWPSAELGGEHGRLAVIAMGKCGGRELNYVSDVDVVFVAEPADTATTKLAGRVMRVAGEACFEVDANLRPEGRQGALVRTLDGHLSYYKRWAKTWEFQALLKARPVAGDPELGAAYAEAVAPLVWSAAGRDDFVADVQAMRRRVEEHIRPDHAARELKLGPGGLRDVEFAVQLLQLVHGRTDEDLRSPSTLEALAALSDGGYVGREDGANLAASYRFLRLLEHRLQLQRMRRTHLLPGRRRHRGAALAGPRRPAAPRRAPRRGRRAHRGVDAQRPAGAPAAREAVLPAAAAARCPGCRPTRRGCPSRPPWPGWARWAGRPRRAR